MYPTLNPNQLKIRMIEHYLLQSVSNQVLLTSRNDSYLIMENEYWKTVGKQLGRPNDSHTT